MTHPVRYALERLAYRLLFCVLIGLFLAFMVPWIWDTLSPFIIAIPIAAALQPLIQFFVKKLHMHRGFAVTFWVVLFSAVAFFIVYWFVSFAVGQVVSAANNAPNLVNGAISVLRNASDRILGASQTMPVNVSDTIRESLNSAYKWIGEQTTSLAATSLNFLVGFASSLPYALIYANFLILGIYFIAGRYPELLRRLQRHRTQDVEEGSLGMLRRSAVKGALGYVRVQLMWFLLLLFLSSIYFQVMGFQYAALIGLLAALLEMIPQFGCGVFYIPWALVCFVIQDAHSAWVVLIFYIAYSMLRRLLDPKLLGDRLGMSPLLSLVGMFMGMRLGGVIGLILGPIAMVVLVSAVRAKFFNGLAADVGTLVTYVKERWLLGREKEPTNTEK
ncbi:MAG TPA: sporulation integral membrane protein YtvI [Candidatus Limiplasma sp.]|nr:sporulation integral membrane protein YtvI [Candidatus Limiplasma sp.]HPS82417.1 sporulation integral membrane protein YtvI [Candidatus Limiplasma sp.]